MKIKFVEIVHRRTRSPSLDVLCDRHTPGLLPRWLSFTTSSPADHALPRHFYSPSPRAFPYFNLLSTFSVLTAPLQRNPSYAYIQEADSRLSFRFERGLCAYIQLSSRKAQSLRKPTDVSKGRAGAWLYEESTRRKRRKCSQV